MDDLEKIDFSRLSLEIAADDLDEINFSRPSLGRVADSGHAFAIPWNRQFQPVLSGFDSSKVMKEKGPWIRAVNSPFEGNSARACSMVYESNGGNHTYRDAFSSQSQSSADHMSVSGSISIGPPFLRAEGSGKYDKTVIENQNGIQSSRIGSCRVGRIIVDQIPAYSTAARALLRTRKGRDQFKERYGDYFIRGFGLGADAGICLAAHSHSKDSKEQLKVSLTVKILFVSDTTEHVERSANHEASADLTVSGYSTMGGDSETLATQSTSSYDQQRIRAVAAKYMKIIARLEAEVERSMRELELKDGARVQLSSAFNICRSGLVVQVLLFPHARTQGYLDGLNSPALV